jgi:hypothetical protein
VSGNDDGGVDGALSSLGHEAFGRSPTALSEYYGQSAFLLDALHWGRRAYVGSRNSLP